MAGLTTTQPGGGVGFVDLAGLSGNAISGFAVIRDCAPAEGLNFGGAPFSSLTGGRTSTTIVLDGIEGG